MGMIKQRKKDFKKVLIEVSDEEWNKFKFISAKNGRRLNFQVDTMFREFNKRELDKINRVEKRNEGIVE